MPVEKQQVSVFLEGKSDTGSAGSQNGKPFHCHFYNAVGLQSFLSRTKEGLDNTVAVLKEIAVICKTANTTSNPSLSTQQVKT